MRCHLAFPILMICGACAHPVSQITCFDEHKLVGLRFFYIVPAKEQSRIVIWNMNSVDSATTARLVGTELNAKGYEADASSKADLLVYVRTFEGNSKQTSKNITLLLDVFDKTGQYKLWNGRAELSCGQVVSNGDLNHLKLKNAIVELFADFPKHNKSH